MHIIKMKRGEKMATKIFIDAGHGGTDPGAIANGVTEQDVNLNVARQLAELLRKNGYEVMEYRTTKVENVLPQKNADLSNRANMANRWGADYFISIHSNSSLNPSANGFEAYVYRLNSRAAELAESIVKSVVNNLGSKNNGVRQANFAVLRRTRMPSVLLELGYVSNPTEALNLNSSAWQKAVAEAIYEGIYNFVKP